MAFLYGLAVVLGPVTGGFPSPPPNPGTSPKGQSLCRGQCQRPGSAAGSPCQAEPLLLAIPMPKLHLGAP